MNNLFPPKRLSRVLAGFALLFGTVATAQTTTAGFPTQVQCEPGQLLYRQVGLGRIGNMVWHNGVLLTNNVGGGNQRWWRFTDPSDPSSLAIYQSGDGTVVPTDQGTHAHTKVEEYVCGGWGCRVRSNGPGKLVAEIMPASRPGEIRAGFTPQNQPAASDSGLHRLYYPWAVPFNWIQYGVNRGTGRIYRGDERVAEWEPLADHGVSGNGILIGNYLFIVSDGSMLGVVAYDLSPIFDDPPGPPRFLDKLTGPFGAYIGAVWENYLVLAGGEPRDLVYVIDYSDPSDLRLVRTLDLSGTPELNAGTNVPYVQTQGRYVFTRRHKIDMETLTPVLELDEVGDHRPLGSLPGRLDVSQYKLPLGNLLITGSYSASGRDGVGVWCHQAMPYTTPPYVGYHFPRPGQTGYPLGAPVSLVIAETLESSTIINGETVLLRPVGGDPVPAWTSFAHDGILTLTPYEHLQPDTTYEVVVVEGGIRSVSGQGIEGYSFPFSTGGQIEGGNAAPEIQTFSATPSPADPGQTVELRVTATDPDNDALEYRFSFGGETAARDWSTQPMASHAYAEPGHYGVKVQVRDTKPDGTHSITTETRIVTVARLPNGSQPRHSSTIEVDSARRVVWVVNPDHDSIGRLNADTGQLLEEIRLTPLINSDEALTPSSVAIVEETGEAWVTLSGGDGIIIFSSSGTLIQQIDTGFGSSPRAVSVSPDENSVYVSTYARGAENPAHGRLLRFDRRTRQQNGAVELGPRAGALAVSGNSQNVYVARVISGEHYGEIWEVDGQGMSLNRTLKLWRDRGVRGLDGGGSLGPGVPNFITSLRIDPHGEWLWYTAVKMDTNRGLFFDQATGLNLASSHDTMVRPMLGRFDLSASSDREPGVNTWDNARIDADNADSPSALLFSPRGDYVFAAMQGNNLVSVFDDLAVRSGGGRSSVARLESGKAPRGLAWDSATDSLWVQNFLSRDLTRIDATDFLASGDRSLPTEHFSSSQFEPLSPDVLAGKQTFFFAGNHPEGVNQMSFEGYVSCASCHLDGGHDGRTWDFTQRGEGLRNTHDLRGRAGMQHGNVHWTGNFDEIQDFALEIIGDFGGLGFLPEDELPHSPLAASNAGRSQALDQLAAYVSSLGRESLPRSPFRAFGGQMSDSAQQGRVIFGQLGCASCHTPHSDYTDATRPTATLHNVGTLRPSSGARLGQTLTGISTPTLLGIWDTEPYLHDGSAGELNDVFSVAGGLIYQAEDARLSGGAEIPGFIEINWDSTSHGRLVRLGQSGATVTFERVDGGQGGPGALELRFLPGSTGEFSVRVNGGAPETMEFSRQSTHFEWSRARLDGLLLNPGPTNTIEVQLAVSRGGWPALDHLTVSTSTELALADPHRIAGSLGASDLDRLAAYLKQLDGRDTAGQPTQRDLLFRDSFQ